MKPFHLGDILSVLTSYLVSPRRMDGIYDACGFLAGESVWTHQIPRICRECGPWILLQHPQLEAVDASGVTPENWRGWLEEQVARFGETLELSPLPEDWHTRINPIEEARAMCGDDRVIAVGPEVPNA